MSQKKDLTQISWIAFPTFRTNSAAVFEITEWETMHILTGALPLVMIAKGTTERCEISQLGSSEVHWTDHSESGWTTEDTFIHYLQWLRQQYDDGKPLWLILDLYSVHRMENVKKYAHDLGILLLFVPAGMTDEFQPLDRAVFGMMKSSCRRMFRIASQEEGFAMSKPMAVDFLTRAWEQVGPEVLSSAWAIYLPDEDDE